MKRLVMLAASLLLIGLAAPAAAQSHPKGVMHLLNGLDTFPTRAHFEAQGGPEVAQTLAVIAQDTTLRRYTRVRAVHALGAFETQRGADVIRALALDANNDREVRIAAIAVLSGMSSAQPQRVDSALDSVAGMHDRELQLAVLRACKRISPQRSEPLLKKLSMKEVAATDRIRNKALAALQEKSAPNTGR